MTKRALSLTAVLLVSCTRAEPPRADPVTPRSDPQATRAAVSAPIDAVEATHVKALVEGSPRWNRATRTALQKLADCRAMFEREDSTHRPGEKFHIYVNGPRDRMIAYQDEKPLEAGSVIVKRTYVPKTIDGGFVAGTPEEEEGTLTAFFVMEKVAGKNPDGGDWIYATARPDGTLLRAGALPDCMGCHEKRRDHDFRYGLDYRFGTPPLR